MQAAMKELRSLKQEEHTMVALASRISDQLNRLKVEELALQNLLRQQNQEGNGFEEDGQSYTELKDDEEEKEPVNTKPLDLEVVTVTRSGQAEEEEEEEEEEEDVHHEDLAQYVESLTEK